MSIDYLLLTLVALTIFLGGSQLAVLFLFTRMLKDLKMDHQNNGEFTAEAKKKSEEIIAKATSDAAKIIADTQASGMKYLSEEKVAADQYGKKLDESMLKIEETFKEHMRQSMEKADQSFSVLLQGLQKTMESHLKEEEAGFSQKTDGMVAKTQELLNKFATDMQQKVQGQVEKELELVKKEIAEYRVQRMAIVDERVIDIIENVMEKVLSKKMSVADQSDLIYKSLEEAKQENAFGK